MPGPLEYACGLTAVTTRVSYHGLICRPSFNDNCCHNCLRIQADSSLRPVITMASRSGWYRCSMIEANGFVTCGLATIRTMAGVSMASCDWETQSQRLTHGKRISVIRTARTDAFPLIAPISISSDARNSPKLTAPRFHDFDSKCFSIHPTRTSSCIRLSTSLFSKLPSFSITSSIFVPRSSFK